MEKTIIDILADFADGNPGAAEFLATVFKSKDDKLKDTVFRQLKNVKTLRGTNLYVLWSDLCDRDLEKVKQLCTNCPDSILEDACSRQDYSGVAMVKDYLK